MTLEDVDWGNGVGVEEEDWVRTEIIARLIELRMGEEKGRGPRLIYSTSQRTGR